VSTEPAPPRATAADIADSQGVVVAALAAVMDGDGAGYRAVVESADPVDLILTLTGSLLFALTETYGDRLREVLAGWQPGQRLGECIPEP
jgi:hypothetical protein